MESPVVIDKPPEYHGNNERGFPFDEEDASGAWSELAARHPDIAARLRQRPSGWASKRRPNSQDATDDFDDGFGVRFPFDDIPPEFRDHFPTHWNRRFQREEQPQQPQQSSQPQQAPASPHQQSSATQTEPPAQEGQSDLPPVDLRSTGECAQQASAADAERAQRSMSAPPGPAPAANMSREAPPSSAAPAAVRHIPIFVEGRDEPVIPRTDQTHPTHPSQHSHPTQHTQPQQTFVPPPPQASEGDYFNDDFFPPRNVARAFGVPFGSNYRQGPQPFTQSKAYPQAASARAASPRRDGDEFVRVPVNHEHRPDTPSKQQQPPQQRQQPPQQRQQPPQQRQPPPQQQPPQQRQAPPPQQQQQHEPSPPPQKPCSNDPITQILSIQTDVLNLMSEVENFTGSKNDKQYMFLDEMLTRNLIKLDNIETDGKENIRQARKEAIRCIQKCIAVLEAKAEKNMSAARAAAADVDMKEAVVTNDNKVSSEEEIKQAKENSEPPTDTPPQPQETNPVDQPAQPTPALDNQTQPQPPDTRPDTDKKDDQKDSLENIPQDNVEKKTPKKGKVVKKRDKSKEVKDNSSKQDNVDNSQVQVDNKGNSQEMEVDGAASQ